jgi:hypothetical protein
LTATATSSRSFAGNDPTFFDRVATQHNPPDRVADDVCALCTKTGTDHDRAAPDERS